MSQDPFFKAHIAGHDYEIPKMTLGEMRTMKQRFGLGQLEDFNPTDPDQLVGLLYLSLIREGVEATAALERAETVDCLDAMQSFTDAAEKAIADAESEAATPRPTADAPPAAGKSGAPATRRKKSGTPS